MRPLRGGNKLVMAAFIPSLFLALIWVFTMPRYAGDEEIAHALHAASVVNQGLFPSEEPTQLNDQPTGISDTADDPVNKTWDIVIPAGLVNVASQRCFVDSPTTTPACAQDLPYKAGIVNAKSTVGGYPPIFAFISGLPGLIFSPVTSLYLSRIIHAMIVAGLLALAARSLWRMYGVRMLAPFIVLITPNVFIIGSGVTPVGIMIASCIALWATASSFAQYGWHLEGRLMVSLSFIASLTTPFAPWMVGVLLAVAMIHAIGPGQWKRRIRIYDYIGPFVVSGMGVLVGIIWNLSSHANTIPFPTTPIPEDTPWRDMIRTSIYHIPARMSELFATLQHQTVELPLWLPAIWAFAVLAILVAGFWYGTDKEQIILIVLIALTLCTPIAIDLLTAKQSGMAWSGLYMAPLFFATTLLSIDIYARQTMGKARYVWTVLWAIPIIPMHIGTWLVAITRFSHGQGTSVLLWHFQQQWFPPLNSTVIVYLLAGALGLLITAASLDCWPDSTVKWSKRPLPDTKPKPSQANATPPAAS